MDSNQIAKLDLKLLVGEVSEKIVVTANSAVLQTESASVGAVHFAVFARSFYRDYMPEAETENCGFRVACSK